MTDDDRLRAELRSLEEAAPADLPPRPSVASPRRWLRLAVPAAVMVMAGTLIGIGLPGWIESLRTPSPVDPSASAPVGEASPPGPAEWEWTRYTIGSGEAHVFQLGAFGRRLIATGAVAGEAAAWFSDDGVTWHRAEIGFQRGLTDRVGRVRRMGPVYGADDRLVAIGLRDGQTPVGYASEDLGESWSLDAEFNWDEDPAQWEAVGTSVRSVIELTEGKLGAGTLPAPGWAMYLPLTALWTSPDGLSWSPIEANDGMGSLGPGEVSGVTHAVSRIFAFGSSGTVGEAGPAIWQSTDGLAWEAPTLLPADSPGTVISIGDAVYARLGTLLAAGVIGEDEDSRRGVLWTSEDGATWNTELTLDAPSELRRAWEYDEETVLAVGRRDGVATLWVWTADDGWREIALDTERSWIDGSGVTEFNGALLVYGNVLQIDSEGQEAAGEAVVWVGRPPVPPQTPLPSTTAAPEGELVPVPTSPPNPTGLCHLALIQGTLVRDPEHGFAILHGGDRRSGIEWPNGYVAREGADGLELLDAEGQVVGREGDGVLLGGSFIGELWRTCGPPDVVPTTLTGVLEGDPELEGGCIWLAAPDSSRWAVQWPDGYDEELRGDAAVLLRGAEVIAREGDEVTVRGSRRDGFSYCGFTYSVEEILAVEPGQEGGPPGGLTHVAAKSMSFVLPEGWTYRLPDRTLQWGMGPKFIYFSNQPMHDECTRTQDEDGISTRCGLPIDELVSDGIYVEWWNMSWYWLPSPPPLPEGTPYSLGGRLGVRESIDVDECQELGATYAELITLPGTSHLRICARDPSDQSLAEIEALLQSIEFWGDEVTIPTQEPPPASGSPLPCAASLIAGTLVRDDTYGVAVDTGDQRVPVVWPYGYFASEGPDGILVLDRHGTVMATEGERVALGGGMDAADERFMTCNY
jgi:hypothetical protein